MGQRGSRLAHAFRALRHRPFRIFWIGQWLSVNGTWMQTTAQAWLVYRLTDSPLVLGILSAVRFGPALVGSPIAGVLTDRLPRRLVVLSTQSLSLVQATLMAVLTLSGAVRVWQVLLLAFFQGIVDTLDTPARQTLQVDIVGVEDLQSAVSLNASAFNAARMVGPALAGVMVAAWGEGVCFAVNAFSYLAVLVALAFTRTLAVASVWMVVIGLGVAIQLSTTNGFLQTTAPPHMRGRVVSLYIWLFSGLSPVGGFAAGWIA